MNLEHFIYHENNLEKPFLPQEDFYANKENIFVVADGITHDLVDGQYPDPSESGIVAKIIAETIVNELVTTEKTLDDIKNAIEIANKKVKEFNEQSDLYQNRETNGYTIGSAVFAVVVIKPGKLLYAVLDDCYFSIFSNDLVDHPILKSYVDISAKHYYDNYDVSKLESRKAWRKEYRNNERIINGEKIGYGAIDGREGYEKFVQYGEEKLKQNDLICLYTDGFIKTMLNLEFIKHIKESDFSEKEVEYVSDFTKSRGVVKEKTCYFIRYRE